MAGSAVMDVVRKVSIRSLGNMVRSKSPKINTNRLLGRLVNRNRGAYTSAIRPARRVRLCEAMPRAGRLPKREKDR